MSRGGAYAVSRTNKKFRYNTLQTHGGITKSEGKEIVLNKTIPYQAE
jgi:hypothetical protein